MRNRDLFHAIAANADLYCADNLANFDPQILQSDWWASLDFFFGHACYQGRSDEISDRVYGNLQAVLSPLFGGGDSDDSYESQRQDGWHGLTEKLGERIGKGHIGKARDIGMAISTLKFIEKLPNKNLVNFSVNEVKNGRISEHYEKLQGRQGGITQVGPKIAAFYLRDVVSLFELERFIDQEAAICLQAVDIWVRRIAKQIGIVDENASDDLIQREIVKMCYSEGISALRFNQGVWYTGFHALDLLLKVYAGDGTAS